MANRYELYLRQRPLVYDLGLSGKRTHVFELTLEGGKSVRSDIFIDSIPFRDSFSISENENGELAIRCGSGGYLLLSPYYAVLTTFGLGPYGIRLDSNEISVGAGILVQETPYRDKEATSKKYVDTADAAKQNKLSGTAGQYVGFDADGAAEAQEALQGSLVSLLTDSGIVSMSAADYAAAAAAGTLADNVWYGVY